MFTDSFQNKEEKQNANLVTINQRIKKLIKKHKFITFELNKLIYIWGDGSYYAPEKLRRYPIRKGMQHEYILKRGK